MTDPTPIRRESRAPAACPTGHAHFIVLTKPEVVRGPARRELRAGHTRYEWVVVFLAYCKDCRRHVRKRSPPIQFGEWEVVPGDELAVDSRQAG